MAFYAIYEIESGEILKVVEYPEFLRDLITPKITEKVIEVEQKLFTNHDRYIVVNNQLISK
ncbi:hypothetical protein [Acinetobacter puyangensis]|uniref:hypothetical protein n=1 Tax=Acinetobacter puyangensis TaxID=1096779 RepID=UPI003A4D8F33